MSKKRKAVSKIVNARVSGALTALIVAIIITILLQLKIHQCLNSYYQSSRLMKLRLFFLACIKSNKVL